MKFLTKEDLSARMLSLGVEPKRSLGQNFLISERVVGKIIDAVERLGRARAALIEVGPGLGSLTESLIEMNIPLKLLELDAKFAEMWRSRGCTVVEGDALQLDWRTLELPQGTLFVSNLPYQISSSLVIERSMEPAGIEVMILMFQKEVAQRLMAKARTDEYGLLTVIAQTFWKPSNLLEAAPREFFPAPNVASRVVVFEALPVTFEAGASAAGYLRFAKAGFAQRRKMLMKNLGSSFVPAAIEAGFADLKLNVQARAEELDPATFLRLYKSVAAAQAAFGAKS